MGVEATSSAAAAAATGDQFAVAVLRKAQDSEKMQGQQALRLIEAAGPQMQKTPDGHISVRA